MQSTTLSAIPILVLVTVAALTNWVIFPLGVITWVAFILGEAGTTQFAISRNLQKSL